MPILGKYTGKEVKVVCQALQDSGYRLPDDLMLCYRFRINRCAADTQPVYIFVRKVKDGAPVANDLGTSQGALFPASKRRYQHPADYR